MRLNWKPSKVFYGWWIVCATFLIALYVGGVIFYGFTAIFEPIANEFGWSYTQISLAASLRGLEASLLAPIIGILVDRWGPRKLIASGAIIITLGLIMLSRTTSLGMFYGSFLLLALGMSTCSVTATMAAVVNWFQEKVGLASGIAISGFGFGGLLVPLMVKLIDMYGWRMTMAVLALGVLAIVLPLSFLFRHKPEQYGYLPDGEVEGDPTLDDGSAQSQIVEVEVKTRQALKSSTFWHIAAAFTCHTMMVSAIITLVMPYLNSIRVAKSMSTLVATAIPLMSVGGRLGFGWLGDKFDRRRVAAIAFTLMGLGLVCFGCAPTVGIWLLVPFLILFGIGYGGSNALRPSMVRELFGRTSFGAIFGLMVGMNMVGGIIGPPLAGWALDNWGSYQNIWFVFAGIAIVAIISVLTSHPISTTIQPVDKT